jgi:HEAT repeat protein
MEAKKAKGQKQQKMKYRFHLFAICALWMLSAYAQAQPLAIKPQPIYEQCSSLVTGAAAADAVARAVIALKDKDAAKRALAAQQLATACDSRAVEPLIEALKDEDAQVRVAAVTTLGKLGDKSSVESLIELIGDKDWRVRLALVSALASLKSSRARILMLNGLANVNGGAPDDENDLRVRCVAALTINQLNDTSYSRKAVMFVYNALQNPHAGVRKMAEQTMYALKDTRNGATELFAILKIDRNPTLRRWAALWIGKIGFERGREVLEQAAANDADAGVKQAAAEALKQMK